LRSALLHIDMESKFFTYVAPEQIKCSYQNS